jgi:hypothetical protein
MAQRKRLLLRLPTELYDAIARWAADDLRSVNAQIEYALRAALRAAGRDSASGWERTNRATGSDGPSAGPDSAAGTSVEWR